MQRRFQSCLAVAKRHSGQSGRTARECESPRSGMLHVFAFWHMSGLVGGLVRWLWLTTSSVLAHCRSGPFPLQTQCKPYSGWRYVRRSRQPVQVCSDLHVPHVLIPSICCDHPLPQLRQGSGVTTAWQGAAWPQPVASVEACGCACYLACLLTMIRSLHVHSLRIPCNASHVCMYMVATEQPVHSQHACTWCQQCSCVRQQYVPLFHLDRACYNIHDDIPTHLQLTTAC
jgi:hypothetical protein